jgi:hypothetical protein
MVWFYFGNMFHVEVTDDEWLVQKVFFVQPKYISYSLFSFIELPHGVYNLRKLYTLLKNLIDSN